MSQTNPFAEYEPKSKDKTKLANLSIEELVSKIQPYINNMNNLKKKTIKL